MQSAEGIKENRVTWSHSICEDCFQDVIGLGDPKTVTRLIPAETETCCFCGNEHRSGIHVRRNPKEMECTHEVIQ